MRIPKSRSEPHRPRDSVLEIGGFPEVWDWAGQRESNCVHRSTRYSVARSCSETTPTSAWAIAEMVCSQYATVESWTADDHDPHEVNSAPGSLVLPTAGWSCGDWPTVSGDCCNLPSPKVELSDVSSCLQWKLCFFEGAGVISLPLHYPDS